MKIHSKYRPYLCVMKDDSRPDMCHVMLDIERRKVYATNGHIAVAIDVTIDEGDKSGLIDAAGYKVIRDRHFAKGPINGLIAIDCSSPEHVESEGIRWPRPKIKRQYPPVESARPKFDDKPTHTFSINANYLRTLALTMGEPEGEETDEDGERWTPSANVSFTVLATETLTEAILIRAYEAEAGADAFLMPLRG